MNCNIVTLDDDIQLEVEYETTPESGDNFLNEYIPKQVDWFIILNIISGDIQDLCCFIDNQKGHFSDLIELKILELED